MSGCGSFNVAEKSKKAGIDKKDNEPIISPEKDIKSDNEKNKFNFNWNKPMPSWIERKDTTIKYN